MLSRALIFAFALALGLSLLASGANAEPGKTQVSALRAGEHAETELRFVDALADFRRAVALGPTSRLARRAQARVEYLEARSEGNFAPLTELERTRRISKPSAEDLRALEQKIPSFPPGRVRREARALVADGYLQRLELYPDALRAHQAWLDEPGLDNAEWLRASNGLALARARLGDLHGSLETLRAHGLGKSAEASYLELALVRRWARPLAIVLVLGFVLLAVGTRSRSPLRAALSPARVVAALWVLGIPLGLAYLHRPETWRTFALLVPGAAGLVLVASLSAGNRTPRIARILSIRSHRGPVGGRLSRPRRFGCPSWLAGRREARLMRPCKNGSSNTTIDVLTLLTVFGASALTLLALRPTGFEERGRKTYGRCPPRGAR